MFNTIINNILVKYPQTLAIFVYGSYAKGKETPRSDVDICILMPDNIGDVMRHDHDLNDEISITVEKQVNCVFSTAMNEWCLKEIYNAKDPFVQIINAKNPLV